MESFSKINTTLEIKDTGFQKNIAVFQDVFFPNIAGIVAMTGPWISAVMENVTFEENDVQHNRGALFGRVRSLVIKDSRFTRNKGTEGAAIHVNEDESITISRTLFEENQCTSPLSGGTLFAMGIKRLSIVDSMFIKNHGSFGGAAYIKLVGKFFISTTVFEECTADHPDILRLPYSGGAVYASFSDGWIENSTFVRNRAGDNGGAIYAEGSKVMVASTVFSENSAGEFGGSISADNAVLFTISKCDFYGNTATVGGGAIRMQVKDVTVSAQARIWDSSFVGNKAGKIIQDERGVLMDSIDGKGGALWIGGTYRSKRSSWEVRNCKFLRNVAGIGAGDVPTSRP